MILGPTSWLGPTAYLGVGPIAVAPINFVYLTGRAKRSRRYRCSPVRLSKGGSA